MKPTAAEWVWAKRNANPAMCSACVIQPYQWITANRSISDFSTPKPFLQNANLRGQGGKPEKTLYRNWRSNNRSVAITPTKSTWTGIELIARDLGLVLHDTFFNHLYSQHAIFQISRCIDHRYLAKVHGTNLVFVKY